MVLVNNTQQPINILEGQYLTSKFTVDGSLEQRFILDNSNIDTSSIVVYVRGSADPGLGKQYKIIDNIVNVTSVSETYLIQEIQDEKYELLFGDGTFGKKLEDGAVITVQYIVTSGAAGNGARVFTFAGSFTDKDEAISTLPASIVVPSTVPTVDTYSGRLKWR